MELAASTTKEVENPDHEKLIHHQAEGGGGGLKKLQNCQHQQQKDADLAVGNSSCKLCLCDDFDADDLMKLHSCACVFCIECMKMYVETLIEDRQQIATITCPDSSCEQSGLLSLEEIKQLLGNDDKFSKFQKLKFEQEVAVDPSRTFCPKSSCSAVCQVNVDENMIRTTTPLGPFAVSCSSCNHQFCYFCQTEWQPLHECPPSVFESGAVSSEFHKLRAKLGLINGGIGANDRTATIKRCPFCGIPIERNRGCAQMICKNCSHVFCWYCLKLLDNDFMLRHYDKGPCRNMLGHSRAQVLRHRLGIIGLFVAFYLLVVISSPILLLAAPIILCCKFKECCKKRHRQLVQRRSHHGGGRKQDDDEVDVESGASITSQPYNPPTTTSVGHITETTTSTKQQSGEQVVAVHTGDSTPSSSSSSAPPSDGGRMSEEVARRLLDPSQVYLEMQKQQNTTKTMTTTTQVGDEAV